MNAHVGTKKRAALHDVDKDSTWKNDYTWIKLDSSKFQMSNPDEIKQSDAEIKKVNVDSESQFKMPRGS